MDNTNNAPSRLPLDTRLDQARAELMTVLRSKADGYTIGETVAYGNRVALALRILDPESATETTSITLRTKEGRD